MTRIRKGVFGRVVSVSPSEETVETTSVTHSIRPRRSR